MDQRVTKAQSEEIEAGAAFGQRVRAARKSSGRSLKDVAGSTGLSISLISKIERGLSAPSMRSLTLLARELDVALSTLVPAGRSRARGRGIVVRANARARLDFGERGLVKEFLTPQPNRELELLLVRLAPGGSTGPGRFSHKGEEGGFVLSGCLELTVGEEVMVLHPGDSFAFASEIGHSYRNLAETETQVLWTNTPSFY